MTDTKAPLPVIGSRCWRDLISPNNASITRLVGAVLLEQDENWHLGGGRMFASESKAVITTPAELPAQPSLQEGAV